MRRLHLTHLLMLAVWTTVACACGGEDGDDAGLFTGAGAGNGGTSSGGRGGSGSNDPSAGSGGTSDPGGKGGTSSKGGTGGTGGNVGKGGAAGTGQPSAGASSGDAGTSSAGNAGAANGGSGGTSGDGGKGGDDVGVAGKAGGAGASAGQGGSDDPGGAGGTTAGGGGSGAGGGGAGGAGGGGSTCPTAVEHGTMAEAADIGTIADNACTRLYSEKQLTGPADEDWIRYAGTDTLGTGCSTEPYAELVSGDAGEVCVFLQPATAASGAIVCLSGTNATSNGIAGCCSKSLARLQFGRYLGIDDATVWVVVRKAATTCAPYRVELGYGG